MMAQTGCSRKAEYYSSISELALLLVYSLKQMKAERDYRLQVLEQELSVGVFGKDSLASKKMTAQKRYSTELSRRSSISVDLHLSLHSAELTHQKDYQHSSRVWARKRPGRLSEPMKRKEQMDYSKHHLHPST